MSNATVGTIQYNAVINTSGLDDGESKVKGVLGGIGKVAAGVAIAGAAATAGLVAASVNAFASYEQLVGGVDTLFKGSSDTVQAYAQNAFKTAGLSANQYMETVTSFSASLLQGLGGDTAKAAEIGNMAVTDMSDNANKMGTSMEMIQNAYQGFAKDNFTMLDNLKLGYGGTQEEMARLINDSKVMGEGFVATAENVKDIPFDKLIEGIHVVQTEMGITGTTAKEASSTITGSFNSTKAAWDNLLVSFASGNNETIKIAVDNLIASATNLVTNVSAILPNIITGVGNALIAIAGQLPTLLQQLLPPLLQFLDAALKTIVTVLPKLVPILIETVMGLVNIIIDNLPAFLDAAIKIIIALVEGLATAAPKLIQALVDVIPKLLMVIINNLPLFITAAIQLIVALIQGIANALPQLIAAIPKVIDAIVKTLTNPQMLALLVGAAIQIIIAVAGGLIKAIPQLVAAIPQIIASLVSGFAQGLGSMATVGADLVKGVWNGISNAKGWIMDRIKSFGKDVLNGLKSFFGIHSPSRLMRDQIGKNLALGIGEGFTSEMDAVSAEMQNAIPTPNIDVNGMGDYGTSATAQPTTIVVKVGDETLLTKIIDGINDKSMLQGYNAIKV